MKPLYRFKCRCGCVFEDDRTHTRKCPYCLSAVHGKRVEWRGGKSRYANVNPHTRG